MNADERADLYNELSDDQRDALMPAWCRPSARTSESSPPMRKARPAPS
jgi:hypothetical protein